MNVQATALAKVHRFDERNLAFAADVLEGLARQPKRLAPKYFYDTRGSELFEQITLLPEYYPTRAEQAILDEVAAEIVAEIRPEELVELGPGSAHRTQALLEPMLEAGGHRYVPVDVSKSAVLESAARLAGAY